MSFYGQIMIVCLTVKIIVNIYKTSFRVKFNNVGASLVCLSILLSTET